MILQPEIAKAFDELLVRARAATLARFDERGLAWLCLVPDWTEPLASSCRFPSGAVSIGEFVDDTAAVGLTKTWETIGSGGEPVRWFSATDDRRVELVQYLRDTRQHDLIAEARTIADRLRKVTGSSAPALQNWAVLVRAAASRRGALSSAETLWAQVRDFADRDDTGPALDWIYAGDALGPLLGAPMTAAVARCRRYLERRYRRRIDDRYLRRLLPRREQEAAVGRLLDGPDDLWALHIVGMGGVGKTMLIRSLTVGPFAQRYKIPVARIDFDHISPDYPLSRPGQLLVELSVELSALFTDADQEAGYERFLDDAERLHEMSGGPGTDPLAMLRTPEAGAVLASFAKLLKTLPKPVLLVLDTCEELAKLHPAGSRIPAVDATFEILERLHKVGQLLGEKRLFRVLFAGRRLLAPAGRDWRADDGSRPPYLENLEERPYLRLLEARGFDRDETVTYLRDRRGLRLDDRQLNAALTFSAEAGRVPGVPRSGGPEPPRYNPYDIDLIGDWLEADPNIDPDALTAAGLDAYVAARIFGRLDTELKPAAAAAALLGRFDEQLLSLAGVPATDRAGRPTIAKLVEQEWVDLEREDSGSRFLQVRAALWPRLQRYASSEAFAEHVGPVRPRLLRELRAHLENAPVRALSFEAVEAYLRLAGPADACAAWATIERRVAEAPADTATSAWSWARSVTERLVGEATGLVISPLLAAVSATLAAAVARTDPAADLRPQWMTVLAGAAAHPDPAVGTELERRAHLGLLAADAWHGVAEPAEAHLACLHEALRSGSDLVGAVLASVEALIESRGPLDIGPEELARWLDTAAARLGGSPAVAWGRSLHARLIARTGDISSALGMLEAAQAAALSAVSGPDAALLDWSPPASVLHRIRAERLWLEWANSRVVPPDRVEREIADALASPGDDGWCLIALAGVVLLDRGHAAQGARALAGVSPQADWSPRCALHRGVPPIVVVQARLLLATGAAAEARVLLRAAITALSTDRSSDARVRWLRIAELELIRALRDPSGASVTGQAIYGDDPDLAAAGWLTAALTEPPRSYTGAELRDALVGSPPYLSDDRLLHARFRSSTPALLGDDPALVAAIRQRDRGAAPSTAANDGPLSIVAIDLWLDALELSVSGVAMPPEPKDPPPLLAAGIAAVKPAAQPGTEFEWARLEVRLRTLSDDTVLELLAGRVPVHRIGRLCLEEGELLALRRPALSESLLVLAYEYARGAGDWGMAVAAAVTGAVAAVHAGDTAALSGQLERARQAWTGLGSVVDGLPAWADLEDAPEPAAPVQTAAAAAWAGWALRLRALLGHGVPPGTAGPAELDLRPWPEGQSPEPPLPESRGRASWLGTVAAVAAGALGAVAVIAGLSWPVRLVVTSVSPSTRLGFVPSFLIAWVLLGVIVMAGIVGPQAGRWLLQLLMSFFGEDVVCEPLDQGQARISVTSELTLVRANAGRWRAAALDIARLGVVSVSLLPSLALFGFARRALRGGMVVAEIPLAPKPPGAYRLGRLAGDADQPFRVTAALHARAYTDQPWEFLLAVSRTKAGVLRRCFRPVTVPWTNLPGVWPALDRAEVVSGQWRAFASEVWARPARLWSSTPTGSPQQAGSDAGSGVARVVHVIGTPLLTSAGWRLRVAGTRSSQVSESFDSSQYTPSSRAGESPAPGLLEPDDPSLSEGVITVVQVDPSGSSIASDPDRAAGLRQFGRQVAVATRQPVIVVPALPVDVASTVMRSLARSVRKQRGEPSLDRTLDWVDRLRRAVLGGRVFGTASWERLAAAYDIALFWPVTDGKETS